MTRETHTSMVLLIISALILLFVLCCPRAIGQDTELERLARIEEQGRFTQDTLQEVANIVEGMRQEQVETVRWRTATDSRLEALREWFWWLIGALTTIALGIITTAAGLIWREWRRGRWK